MERGDPTDNRCGAKAWLCLLVALACSIATLACGSGGEGQLAARHAGTGAGSSHSTEARAVKKPRIVRWLIPFPRSRKKEMAAYARRHYGLRRYRLRRPRVIVQHYSQTRTARAVYNTFAPDHPDPELHELPNVCAHFVVDRNGTIYQLVSLSLMCRHVVGLNHVAIGIEHVAQSDRQVMSNRRQLGSSLRLTRWLACRYGIAIEDVIGHAESLSSPYHYERVARLRRQTHSDMGRRTMKRYRRLLAARGRCVRSEGTRRS